MENYIQRKYTEYKKKSNISVTMQDFKNPKTLLTLHEHLVGSVVHEIYDHLKSYKHMTYFGCMLFFSRLTDDLIMNGPIHTVTSEGKIITV